jgi:diaminopimelate decarboxylase
VPLKLLEVKTLAESLGFEIKHFDVGGGFPVSYHIGESETPIEKFAETLVPLLKNIGAKILFEPGRFITANASIVLSKVLYIKQNADGKKFIVLDAAMTELIRPALYGSYHEILAAKKKSGKITADIVGPVCESGDFFARARDISPVKEGDYVALMSVGAYGNVMSSNYNARPRAAEVMINKAVVKLTRKRETLEQMIENER